MTQSPKELDGYQMNEYLIVLLPKEELANKIKKVGQDFAIKYRLPGSHFLNTYITLVHFSHLEINEEKLVKRLQIIAMALVPFKIELINFGSLPSHSIYINVVSKLPIQNIVRSLKEAQTLMTINKENKAHFIEEPNINIARKLKPWQYEQGWLELSNTGFTSRFIAENMVLLKRIKDSKTGYKILKRFDFQSLPLAIKQGNLF